MNSIFSSHNISLFAPLDISYCKIINPKTLARRAGEGFFPKTVVIFAVPYFVAGNSPKNISLYAVSEDYHRYFNTLFDTLICEFENKYGGVWHGFADNSPINEKHAAAIGGLGVFGDNGLLITKNYGSYVFLGELIGDVELKFDNKTPSEIFGCLHCEKCKNVCPGNTLRDGGECLSAITQKKGALCESEISMMKSVGTVWGCDLCQSICPMNKNVKESEIRFFHENRIENITKSTIEKMDDQTFSRRAYSWRGREVILRNLFATNNE